MGWISEQNIGTDMGKRSTDSKFNPVTILLGVVSFLLTVTLGLLSFSIAQYEKKSDRMYNLVDIMNTTLQANLIRSERQEVLIHTNIENIKKNGSYINALGDRVYKLEKR